MFHEPKNIQKYMKIISNHCLLLIYVFLLFSCFIYFFLSLIVAWGLSLDLFVILLEGVPLLVRSFCAKPVYSRCVPLLRFFFYPALGVTHGTGRAGVCEGCLDRIPRHRGATYQTYQQTQHT